MKDTIQAWCCNCKTVCKHELMPCERKEFDNMRQIFIFASFMTSVICCICSCVADEDELN